MRQCINCKNETCSFSGSEQSYECPAFTTTANLYKKKISYKPLNAEAFKKLTADEKSLYVAKSIRDCDYNCGPDPDCLWCPARLLTSDFCKLSQEGIQECLEAYIAKHDSEEKEIFMDLKVNDWKTLPEKRVQIIVWYLQEDGTIECTLEFSDSFQYSERDLYWAYTGSPALDMELTKAQTAYLEKNRKDSRYK